MRIACLHTAASNAAVFDAACPAGVMLHHAVRPDLLSAAEAAGGLTPAIAAQTVEALRRLEGDAVLLTCSTIGPAAEEAGALRADAALAARACAGGGVVEVLCAAPSALRVTAELFAEAAEATGARVTLRLVPGAWALFHAGDLAAYAEAIARDAEDSRADAVALAQVSMTPAARLTRRVVLSVPESALAACLERS